MEPQPSSETFGSESHSLNDLLNTYSIGEQQHQNELLATIEADTGVVAQSRDGVDDEVDGQATLIVTHTRQENEITVENEPHHVTALDEAEFVTGTDIVDYTIDTGERLLMLVIFSWKAN